MSSINAEAQQNNAVAKFETDFSKLLEAMGKDNPVIMPNGSAVNIYKEGTEASVNAAAEGALIGDSKLTPVLDKTVSLTWSKKLSYAPFEKIQVQGYDVCVGGTIDKLLKIGAGIIRTSLCDAIKAGTTTATAGATVQAAAANAVAKLMEKTADEYGTPIFFMSPATFAKYAGSANITPQEAYGLHYLAGFLGIGNAIVLYGLADDKVYATTVENINLYAAQVGSIEGMTTDCNGAVAFGVQTARDHASEECVMYFGIQAFLNILDRCCVSSVNAA